MAVLCEALLLMSFRINSYDSLMTHYIDGGELPVIQFNGSTPRLSLLKHLSNVSNQAVTQAGIEAA